MATAATRTSRPVRSGRRALVQVHRQFGLSDADAIDMYYAMLVTRRISEQALKLAFQGAIDVSIPADGHEAAQIASMRALRPTDPAYLFYRSSPAAYARGMTAREILLEYFGQAARRGHRQRGLLWRWRFVEVRLSRGAQLRRRAPVSGGAVLREQRHGDLGAVRKTVGCAQRRRPGRRVRAGRHQRRRLRPAAGVSYHA